VASFEVQLPAAHAGMIKSGGEMQISTLALLPAGWCIALPFADECLNIPAKRIHTGVVFSCMKTVRAGLTVVMSHPFHAHS
jgi:hypothetical protein